MREVPLGPPSEPADAGSFRACVATVLELRLERVPRAPAGDAPAPGPSISRWLGGFGLGIARLAEPSTFAWPGPWIARVHPPGGEPRFAVMFGVPSGVVWDPAGDGIVEPGWIVDGYLIAAADVALSLRPPRDVTTRSGTVEAIYVAEAAGRPARRLDAVHAFPGRGLEGDRYLRGTGTFASGPPGSALTLIEGDVCDAFDPPLAPDEHRRNIVTRGIGLNDLVGAAFTIGRVRCRGLRLCEPCVVIERYASRPVLRPLVHRGGLRADILDEGEIHVGDAIEVTAGVAHRSA